MTRSSNMYSHFYKKIRIRFWTRGDSVVYCSNCGNAINKKELYFTTPSKIYQEDYDAGYVRICEKCADKIIQALKKRPRNREKAYDKYLKKKIVSKL